MAKTFSELEQDHRELSELLVQHQIALTELDLDRALRLLAQFDREIRAHAAWEDKELLPIYEKRAEPTHVGDPAILRAEHHKIEGHLDLFRARVQQLDPDDPDLRRRVIAVIDDQRIFKQVLKHHAEREEKTLYPILDDLCTEEERRRILAKLPRHQEEGTE